MSTINCLLLKRSSTLKFHLKKLFLLKCRVPNDTHIDQSGSVGEYSSLPSGPMDRGCCCNDPELKPEDAKDGIIALINQIQ